MTCNISQTLLHKLNSRQASVAVIGLGYVGLPLAVAFAESGSSVIGIDVDAGKVEAINEGRSGSSPQVTAIIPAFNEAGRIGKTICSVRPFVDEVIVVDDGSHDRTADEAREAGAQVLQQDGNRGYIAAIKRGFMEAGGDIVITLDADGEFPPEFIPALVQPILNGEADMVQGRRDVVPRPSERFLTWMANLKAPVGDSGTGLRAIRTELARQLTLKGSCICGIFSLEVVAMGGRIKEIPVRLQPIAKPRRIAWYHLKQIFFLLPWLIKRSYPGS